MGRDIADKKWKDTIISDSPRLENLCAAPVSNYIYGLRAVESKSGIRPSGVDNGSSLNKRTT